MKILHFFPWTSWGSLGGTEKYIIEISKRQSVNHDVYVAFPKRKKDVFLTEINHFREIAVENMNPNGNKFIGLGIIPSVNLVSWIKLLRKEHFEVVHFHCYEPYLLWLVIASKFFKIKIVFTSHIVNFTCANGKLSNSNNEICDGKVQINRCSNCVRSTSIQKKEKSQLSTIINLFIKKIHLFVLKFLFDLTICINDNYQDVLSKNGFDKHRIKVIKPTNLIFDYQNRSMVKIKKLKVIYVGRISHLKGLHILLSAFKKLDKNFFSLDIFGPISDLDLTLYHQRNIKYMGEYQFSDTNRILQNYDVLCLPSISYEMTPLSIIEAVNNGLYVIGSDVPGISELIMNKGINGKIVKRNSTEALVEALEELKHGYLDNSKNQFTSLEMIADEISLAYQNLI